MKIVIRTPNWIGDVILALPAIESVTKNFPEAEIWLAASGWVQDLFASDESAPNIIPLGRLNHLKNLRSSARQLKESGFDIGLLLTNSFASALLFYLAGIRSAGATGGTAAAFFCPRAFFGKNKRKPSITPFIISTCSNRSAFKLLRRRSGSA